MSTPPARRLDVWLLATGPDSEPVALHGVSELTDHDTADAFDRLMPSLVAELRERLTGEKR